MVSQAKIDANRRNAAKSTGPRTAQGKDKVRFNAVTHGLTATTVVLPHEDEQAYQHRLEAWTSELKAPGDFGQHLVARLVKISWQLDRADTFEQAKLTKRIQDAPRLFGKRHAEPAEILFARLLGTEAETTEQEPVGSRSPRRSGKKAGPVPVNEPALLLRKLEASSEGCRLLLEEWTRLLEWLGRLGPDRLATCEVCTKLDNLVRALGLLGVRIADTEAGSGAVATANPLAASFLQAWQLVEDRALREFMELGSDEDDDPPPPEGYELVAPEVMASHWAAVGGALLNLAAERCARLRTLTTGYEQSEAEARARLASEASFDDSAEGGRVHRYQARWGRSLLRTLASLEELRDRGGLDHQNAEACVGRDANLVIPFIEETRLVSCPTGGRDENEGSAGSVEAHLVKETERGHDRAATDERSIRHQEKVQNKPTAVTRVLVKCVKMRPCGDEPVGSKATMAHSPCRGSDQSGDRSGDATRASRASQRHIPHDPPQTRSCCLG